MKSKDEIMLVIYEHMKLNKLTDVQHSVSKANIVLKVTQKLSMPEADKRSVIEAFDYMYEINMLRSSKGRFSENSVGYSITVDDERFYLDL